MLTVGSRPQLLVCTTVAVGEPTFVVNAVVCIVRTMYGANDPVGPAACLWFVCFFGSRGRHFLWYEDISDFGLLTDP